MIASFIFIPTSFGRMVGSQALDRDSLAYLTWTTPRSQQHNPRRSHSLLVTPSPPVLNSDFVLSNRAGSNSELCACVWVREIRSYGWIEIFYPRQNNESPILTDGDFLRRHPRSRLGIEATNKSPEWQGRGHLTPWKCDEGLSVRLCSYGRTVLTVEGIAYKTQ